MEDEEYKAAVEEPGDVALDFAESNTHKLIDSSNPCATILYLKTKGKERGYGQGQEIAVGEKKPAPGVTGATSDGE